VRARNRYPRRAVSAETPAEQCRPCRGTGTVISTLGGERREVTCPWCEGRGTLIGGHDAQDRKAGAEGHGAGRAPDGAGAEAGDAEQPRP